MPPGQVDSLDVRQRTAGGHEAAALPVVKPNAKRRGRTAAAVVGAAAAQTQDQALCAVIQRVGQKLSHTVGGGCLRVGDGPLPGAGPLLRRTPPPPCRRQQAVEAIDSAAKGTGHGKGDTLSAAGIQKAVCGALAAIGHRQGVDVPAGDMETAGDAADVRGGQRAFE